MKRYLVIGLVTSALALAGCQLNYEDMNAAQRAPLSDTGNSYTYKPNPNAPIQVTYRIDEYRFVTLENYDRCFGDNYYNDTRIGVHQKVWTGVSTDYQGRLVIDDPSGTNIVLPTARNSLCGDRGCKVPLFYSTDSGRTFKRMVYMNNSSDPSRDSKDYTIATTKDALYIARSSPPRLERGKSAYVRKAPLYPLADLTNLDRSKGVWETGDKAPPFPSSLRTPTGQDRFTCDASIRSAGQPTAP